jgi:hypothetical protein
MGVIRQDIYPKIRCRQKAYQRLLHSAAQIWVPRVVGILLLWR